MQPSFLDRLHHTARNAVVVPPRSALIALFAVSALAGCASAPPATENSPSTRTTPSGGTGGGGVGVPAQASGRWIVTTVPHIDLWLHSFAMIQLDTSPVPLFKRGYRDSVSNIKRRNNVLTSLDANRETLARRFSTNPALIQAQFLALGFSSFQQMRSAIDAFLQFQGDPQRAPNSETATAVAQLAAIFPANADREWLRLFMAGVLDEQSRFYDAEYQRTVRDRGAVVSAVESLWRDQYYKKFERFLNNTSQRQGEILLSLPLGPEGRTSLSSERQTVVAVPFPGRSSDAIQAILVVAHEVVGNLVSGIVADNTTPAQQRSGESGNFLAFGQVHAGLLMLQKVAPELVEPYARYYLAQGGHFVPSMNAATALANAYPVPQAIRDGLARQIQIVLGGI